MSVAVRRLSGPEIHRYLADLAKLRIAVFSAYPYLYDGDEAYEADYIREFAQAPDAVLVAALDGEKVVGAATASPMWAQKPAFREPFEKHGLDTTKLFYFGESVLLPGYRGQRIGHAFFDHREEAAQLAGANAATFAAVIRPADHPARPGEYSPLDPFWRKRGYEPVAGLVTCLNWKEHGDREESPKSMQYWLRQL